MKRVLAMIVAYNRPALLKESIEQLLSQSALDELDILIVDNSTTDKVRKYIFEHIENKEIIYIGTDSKLSSAAGFQYGMRYAVEHGYEFVWMMDDDCIPTKTTLEEFLKWDNELSGNYGFLSSKALWKDGSINRMALQKKSLFSNVKDFSSNPIRVDFAGYVSIFIPTNIIKDVGLSIKEFFIWSDDWEYTRRISRKYPCYLITSSIVIHKSATNIGGNIAFDSLDRLYRYNYLYRNDVYIYRREGFKGFVYEVLRLTNHSLRVIFKAKDNRFKRLKCIFKGTIAGFSFNPQIEFCNQRVEV